MKLVNYGCDDGGGSGGNDDGGGSGGNDDGGGDGGGNDGGTGGGKPVSVVALVFQESRERRRPVLATLMNYNQFALSFLKLDN